MFLDFGVKIVNFSTNLLKIDVLLSFEYYFRVSNTSFYIGFNFKKS